MQFKSQLRDQFGEPVNPLNVRLVTTRDRGVSYSRSAVLGEGFSDDQGNIDITFLKPKGFDTFYVWINDPEFENTYAADYGTVLVSRSFMNLSQNQFELAPVLVDKVAGLNVILVNRGVAGDTLRANLRYRNPSRSIPEEEVPLSFKFAGATLLNGETRNILLGPVIGESVTMDYEIRNNGLVQEGSLIIEVSNAQQEFRYEYP